MIITISPAKTINLDSIEREVTPTLPLYPKRVHYLASLVAAYSVAEIANMMNVSTPLAQLAYERTHSLVAGEGAEKMALFAFDGAVYRALDAETLSPNQLHFAQEHLCILSGMYGMLRPFDLIRPYRLEMGIALPNEAGKTLYPYWQKELAKTVGERLLADDGVWVNLASTEYSKAIPLRLLPKGTTCITPIFKELRPDGSYKTIATYAKTARGAMSRYVITNGCKDVEELKGFTELGYGYMPHLSTATEWVFVR